MSQKIQILNYMLQGNSITPLEALNKFGCFRLSARIIELRKLHKIKDKWIEQNNKRFKAYYMEK